MNASNLEVGAVRLSCAISCAPSCSEEQVGEWKEFQPHFNLTARMFPGFPDDAGIAL